MRNAAALAVLAVLFSTSARAADFYVDPVNGSPSGDGSANRPWRTIEEVIAASRVETQNWASLPYSPGTALTARNADGPVKPGDTIWLRSGYHGALSIAGHYNRRLITIAAQQGHTPTLSHVTISASANWRIRGLHISPSFAPAYETRAMVRIQSDKANGPVHDVFVEDCRIFSVNDTSSWTLEDWNNKAANAIQAGGTKITIRGNRAKNVNFGISVSATHSLVEHNVVENFAGDGMRGLGNHTVFQYNIIKNCYDVNANHDDGFQSWSVGTDGKVGTGQVTGIVLRGNRIINYEDPNQPFRGTLQGIGLFDGTFVDWIIENNVVITDHWHGITVLGAKNTRIVNNTVLDRNTTPPGPPWIMVGNHKNGTPPENCIVRNNLATAFRPADKGVVSDHNLVVEEPAALFVNVAAFDVRLLPSAAAIDAGSPELAPAADIERTSRPQGRRVDIGAHEWRPHRPGEGEGLDLTTGTTSTAIGVSTAGRFVFWPEVHPYAAGRHRQRVGEGGRLNAGNGAHPTVTPRCNATDRTRSRGATR